jgi:hypothetical protein
MWKTSVVTPEESWRFPREAYRIILYCNIFPGTCYNLDELAGLHKAEVKKIQRQRTAVLNEYPTDELQQVYAVARFMRDVLETDDEDNGAPVFSQVCRRLYCCPQRRTTSST